MQVGYSYDAICNKFTGKERDSESGLDNFGKRYFGSSLGRFMTPDPLHIMKQKLIDPQQWNMYAYVRNNPLRFTDPTGMYTCADQSNCKSKQDRAFETARQNDLKSKIPQLWPPPRPMAIQQKRMAWALLSPNRYRKAVTAAHALRQACHLRTARLSLART